jgi:hypothetical protein
MAKSKRKTKLTKKFKLKIKTKKMRTKLEEIKKIKIMDPRIKLKKKINFDKRFKT